VILIVTMNLFKIQLFQTLVLYVTTHVLLVKEHLLIVRSVILIMYFSVQTILVLKIAHNNITIIHHKSIVLHVILAVKPVLIIQVLVKVVIQDSIYLIIPVIILVQHLFLQMMIL
jgi:hypothetical protein